MVLVLRSDGVPDVLEPATVLIPLPVDVVLATAVEVGAALFEESVVFKPKECIGDTFASVPKTLLNLAAKMKKHPYKIPDAESMFLRFGAMITQTVLSSSFTNRSSILKLT